VPQVHLPAAAGERALQLQRAPAPLPEPDHHVPVQALVLPLLPDLRLQINRTTLPTRGENT
jgi:hypothetical protein